MTTINWLTLRTLNPMGQQNYEQAITDAMAQRDSRFEFLRATVGSARSGADISVPVRPMERSSFVERAAVRLRYPPGPTHRFDLRIPPAPGPEVVTVHDLPPARFSDEGQLPSWAWRSLRGTAVICPSAFAAQEVADLLGADDITVIPYGVRPAFNEPEPLDNEALTRMNITGRFVLHAAGSSVRKNLKALAYAWSQVSDKFPDVQLVLCGPEHPVRTALFSSLPRTVLAGPVPLDRIPRLMAAADVVVVPSTYEGFGLPALEALAVGTAALVARAGALPEVVGDAALVVGPDARSLAAGLLEMLGDPALRSQLRAAGLARASTFRWDTAAAAHLEVYERVFGRG